MLVLCSIEQLIPMNHPLRRLKPMVDGILEGLSGQFDGDWELALASYNAGQTRIRRLRREAAQNGLDPNVWHDNVEILAAREIGRETVQYVDNIYKYYLSFVRIEQQREKRARRAGE